MNNPLPPTRRSFLQQGSGAAAMGALALPTLASPGGVGGGRHHPARAKRIVYLFQSGGPSQLDLFDHKPLLQKRNGEELPDSVRQGQRLTGMSGNQSSLPLAGAQFRFARHGQCGRELSELVPNIASIADEVTFVRSMHTEAINHDPGITFSQTGSQLAGRPSLGAWLDFGLGSDNRELPAYCVLVSKNKGGQPLYQRLWGSGFLPARHQGVQFRPGRDRVLFLADPPGIDRATRRRMLDSLRALHEGANRVERDAAIDDRIAQYEMAYRMQRSVPEVSDLSDEPDSTFALYGEDARDPGTYAANCVLARRLLERGVRCVQLFHKGWDQHGGLPKGIRVQCRETDQASAGLVLDLKRRGLLDDTLVVWGGEFGRTNYSQGRLTSTTYGRDHHPRCYTVWLAGGGIKKGHAHGETDEFGYNIARDPVHVHDLNATLLHLLGVDHERLTFAHQGRDYRLTDVEGRVVRQILA
ncbi:MAG: DUF1501 domain-containing protein [Planctomycetota bacterium]